MTEVSVTKASGEREPFSEDKLRRSLQRSAAPPPVIDTIAQKIRGELTDGISTSAIYRRAFAMLRAAYPPAATRYSLKQAIIDMGPSGHPFEILAGEILEAQGYKVQVATIVPGYCVQHEVDVVAEKGNHHIMCECKFHHQKGLKVDVKVALYIQARFLDIEKAWQAQAGHAQKFHEAWLITNTKLTTEAIQYARCVGIKAIGWDYPAGAGLNKLIDDAGLHPVTSLKSLNAAQKRQLLEKGIVSYKDLDMNSLGAIGLTESMAGATFREMARLGQVKNRQL